MKTAFDTNKYINIQRKEILKKVRELGGKLYFELGGKLLDDYHAARVLPGFEPDTKMRLLESLKKEVELVICINAEDIENGRIRSDFDILYTEECERLIENYRKQGFLVSGIALTVFKKQPKAEAFADKMKSKGEKVYFLNYIPDYPNNKKEIISSFKKNDFIITTKPIVVMTSPGSGSGKLSACLSQIYKEYKNGNTVGYAKYDIFPVWNLAVNHPVNVAFQAATADLGDEILIDTFYYEKYHECVSNYNRDLDVFPIIRDILKLITGKEIYSSPTEMVINMMKYAITDEALVCKKARQEICRRYLTYQKQYIQGNSTKEVIDRVEHLMKKNNIKIAELEIVPYVETLIKANPTCKMIALELEDDKKIVAKEDAYLTDSAKLIVLALRDVANVNVSGIKMYALLNKKQINALELKNLLIKEKDIIKYLNKIKGLNAHASYILSTEEEQAVKSFGINITCNPRIL